MTEFQSSLNNDLVTVGGGGGGDPAMALQDIQSQLQMSMQQQQQSATVTTTPSSTSSPSPSSGLTNNGLGTTSSLTSAGNLDFLGIVDSVPASLSQQLPQGSQQLLNINNNNNNGALKSPLSNSLSPQSVEQQQAVGLDASIPPQLKTLTSSSSKKRKLDELTGVGGGASIENISDSESSNKEIKLANNTNNHSSLFSDFNSSHQTSPNVVIQNTSNSIRSNNDHVVVSDCFDLSTDPNGIGVPVDPAAESNGGGGVNLHELEDIDQNNLQQQSQSTIQQQQQQPHTPMNSNSNSNNLNLLSPSQQQKRQQSSASPLSNQQSTSELNTHLTDATDVNAATSGLVNGTNGGNLVCPSPSSSSSFYNASHGNMGQNNSINDGTGNTLLPPPPPSQLVPSPPIPLVTNSQMGSMNGPQGPTPPPYTQQHPPQQSGFALQQPGQISMGGSSPMPTPTPPPLSQSQPLPPPPHIQQQQQQPVPSPSQQHLMQQPIQSPLQAQLQQQRQSSPSLNLSSQPPTPQQQHQINRPPPPPPGMMYPQNGGLPPMMNHHHQQQQPPAGMMPCMQPSQAHLQHMQVPNDPIAIQDSQLLQNNHQGPVPPPLPPSQQHMGHANHQPSHPHQQMAPVMMGQHMPSGISNHGPRIGANSPHGGPGSIGQMGPMGPIGDPNMAGPSGNAFMQQNTVYVFTTAFANEAADAVTRGRCRSIIEYHHHSPATSEFLKTVGPMSRAPPGPLADQNLTSEQLKKRNEKLGKLKNISTMFTSGSQSNSPVPSSSDQSPAQAPPSKRGRGNKDSNQEKQLPQPGMNGPAPMLNDPNMFAGHMQGQMPTSDQFNNPNMPPGIYNGPPGGNPYQQDWNRTNMGMGGAPNTCSSPSLQQQQGPPPPYGSSKPNSKHKGSDKKGSNLHPQSPNTDMFKNSGSIMTSGLQTTPSPQLMNYVEFEGQELTITKQLNANYKGPINDDPNDPQNKGNNFNQYGQPLMPPNSNPNSTILNCLNSNNLGCPDDMKIKNELLDSSNPYNDSMSFNGGQPPSLEDHPGSGSAKKSNKHASLQGQQQQQQQQQQPPPQPDHYYNTLNSPLNPNSNQTNNVSSPLNGMMGVSSGGPLNSMLQMTNSIPKSYGNAKSPGLNHPMNTQFSQPPASQISLSPGMHGKPHNIMPQQGPDPNILMGPNGPGQQGMPGMPGQQQAPPSHPPSSSAPPTSGSSRRGHSSGHKMTKKEKEQQQQQLQQQQQQQEMLMHQQQQQQRGGPSAMMIDPNAQINSSLQQQHGVQRGPGGMMPPPGGMNQPPQHILPPHLQQQMGQGQGMPPGQMMSGQGMQPIHMHQQMKGGPFPQQQPQPGQFRHDFGNNSNGMIQPPSNKMMRTSLDSSDMIYSNNSPFSNGPIGNGANEFGMPPQQTPPGSMMMMNNNEIFSPQLPNQVPSQQAPPPAQPAAPSAPASKSHRSSKKNQQQQQQLQQQQQQQQQQANIGPGHMQPNSMLDMDMGQRMMNPNGPPMGSSQMMNPHIMKPIGGQQFGGGGMMDNQQQMFNPNQPQDPNMMTSGNRNQMPSLQQQQQQMHRQQSGPPPNMMPPMHQMDSQQMQMQQQQMGRHPMGINAPVGPQQSGPFEQNMMMSHQMPPHMQQQQPFMNNQGQMMHPNANFLPNDQVYVPQQMVGMDNGQMLPPHMLHQQQQQQQDQFNMQQQQQIGGMPPQQQQQMITNPDLLSSYTDFKPDFDQILFTE